MFSFADSTGKSYTVSLTIGDVARVKALSDGKFDLLSPEKLSGDPSQELRQRLDEDLLEFFELLCLLVDSQLRASEITAEQFGERMDPKSLLDAQERFFREWIDFFRQLQRPQQWLPLEKMTKYRKLAAEKVQRQISRLDLDRVDRQVDEAMDLALKTSSGKLLEELDSILGRTPGGNYT